MTDDGLTTEVLKTFLETIIQERDARYQQQFTAHDALQAERDKRYAEQRASDLRFDIERDRRYTEVAAARAEALKIKEEADKIALGLQRDNQIYKDEKANELREQINSERGLYATKDDLAAAIGKIEVTMAPLLQYAATQQGRSGGLQAGWGYIIGAVGLVGALLAIIVFFTS
jgi:hypothetical protein